LNANSNRAIAHVWVFFLDLNLIQIFSSARQMHAMMMTKYFIYLTSLGCYISPLREGISLADFCQPESFSLSGVLHPAEAAVSISEPPI
jgi:hypothetical protein